MNSRFRLAAATVCLAALITGCDGGGESARVPTAPAPAPAPAPPPPPPEPTTWIGFADPARARLIEGGRVRAVVQISGDLLESPLRLAVQHSAPGDQLLVADEVEIERRRHGAVEIVGAEDDTPEAGAGYEITLLPPAEGLPPGVVLDEAATTFRVIVEDGDPRPDCRRLELDATRERFDSRDEVSTARITLEGPQNVALRLSEPYWTNRFDDWEKPPELPIDLSAAPPVSLVIPESLAYQPLAASGHRQRITLAWYWDLDFAAVAPECRPVRLRCRRSGRSTRCSP